MGHLNRVRRGEYGAGAELRYVYRCAACCAERQVSFGKTSAPVRLSSKLPSGWVPLPCESLARPIESLDPPSTNLPLMLWLCSGCAATPEESRAVAALRHPIRILP